MLLLLAQKKLKRNRVTRNVKLCHGKLDMYVMTSVGNVSKKVFAFIYMWVCNWVNTSFSSRFIFCREETLVLVMFFMFKKSKPWFKLFF